MSKWLRVKKDGFIYRWNPIMAQNPGVEEITEVEAFPEKSAPPKTVAKAKARASKVDLSVDDFLKEEAYTSPEIQKDASRKLPE